MNATHNTKERTMDALIQKHMETEIVRALKTFGEQPTSVLSYAFQSGNFNVAIRKLHKDGLIEKTKRGWKAKG